MTYLDGIDISKWQPQTPSLRGLAFGIARATYATTIDPKYAMHVANFRKAGLVVGAYCFGVGFKPVHEQVRVFLNAAKGADLLVLDLERDSTKTMTQAEAREFIRLVHAAGHKIGLYHSRSGFPELGQDYNWVAQWRSTPPTGIKWAFWQLQGSPLDRDKFNGNKAQLLALAGRAPIEPPAQPVPPKEAPVATEDQVRLGKAIDTRAGYLNNEIAAGDEGGILTQAAKIADFATRLVVSVAGPAADTSEYFLDFGEGADTVYLPGGSPGNPNGVSFTFAGARKWWEEVFAKGYNIGKVRSTLTPGSKVLSPEGYDAAVALARTSVNFAPEDYNPLGLDVIP